MKKLLAIAVSAAFAVSSFGALAQDKKKDEVKSAQGAGVKSQDKGAVTTATGKPENAEKGAMPKNLGKKKTEAQRMEEQKNKK